MQETIELLRRQASALHKAADMLEEVLRDVVEETPGRGNGKSRRSLICNGWLEDGQRHECGKEFTPTGPRSIRCPDCATRQRRANDAYYYARRQSKRGPGAKNGQNGQ